MSCMLVVRHGVSVCECELTSELCVGWEPWRVSVRV